MLYLQLWMLGKVRPGAGSCALSIGLSCPFVNTCATHHVYHDPIRISHLHPKHDKLLPSVVTTQWCRGARMGRLVTLGLVAIPALQTT